MKKKNKIIIFIKKSPKPWIEHGSPAWQAGILTTILLRILYFFVLKLILNTKTLSKLKKYINYIIMIILTNIIINML